MRILYHHRTLGDGAEGIHIKEMVAAFRELGHDVRVVALAGESGNGKAVLSTKQRSWTWLTRLMPGHVYELAEIAYNFVGRRNILREVKRFKPDLIYDRYNSYCTAALEAGRKARVPVVLEVNAPIAYERNVYEKLKLKYPGLASRYEERICSGADHVFAVSTPLRDFLVEKRNVAERNVTVLPNGANPEKFDPNFNADPFRRELGVSDKFVIGFVGILRQWHGVELLLQVFANLNQRHSDLHLVLLGDGPMQDTLERLARNLGVADLVSFTGRKDHESVKNYVATMDVAVSPRATFYASPMKILEYMAMGVPTVAPNMPNIRDIVEHGEDGLLFDAENPHALEQALERLLTNRTLAHTLGTKARQKIVSQLNWERNAREVVHRANLLLH